MTILGGNEEIMETKDVMDKTAIRVAAGVMVALIVDGLNLQVLALSLPNFMEELNISPILAGALSSYTLIGMGIGGIGAGWLADRIGRVWVTMLSVATFSLCTIIIGFSQTYWQIAVMLFISGFGLGGAYSVGSVLAAEYVPTRIRNTVLGILQAGWSVGYVVAAAMASYILPTWGWRPLFIMAFLPGIIVIALLWGVRDPVSWFTTRAAARQNSKKGNEYMKIWRDPKVRKNFLFWSAASICLQFSYYGANTWLPSYLVKDLGVNLKAMGWYLAATYTCMVLGKVITGWFGDKLGRRFMWVFACLATAIALPLIMHIATPASVTYLLFIFGFLYGAPYAVNATYMSESFPTAVRGTALATAYNIGRLGSTISPLMIGWAASTYSVGFGIALLGISYTLCGLIPGIFIPQKMYDPKAVAVETKKDDAVSVT